MFIDTHAHLHFQEFGEDREDVIGRASEAGVEQIITLGTDFSSSIDTLKIANLFDNIFAAVGIHPSEAHLTQKEDYEKLKTLAEQESKIVAIGETGLDFYWDKSHPEEQYSNFRMMLDLAKSLRLPVVIHNRSAHREMEWFFQEEKISDLNGVMHCFSGDLTDARFYLDMGLHISFTGNITYDNFGKLDVVKYIPLNRLLLETDSPYMAPEPFRKGRNEPAYVCYVAEKLAILHKKPVDKIGLITTENAKKLFGL